MLDSLKITTRQSEIREKLAELAAIEKPDDAQVTELRSLDDEYKTNETRFRAALVVEEASRKEAGQEFENRSDTEKADILAGFEIRQVAAFLVEGKTLEGQTAEIVQEMRQDGYRGCPIPWEALETRAGETIAGGTPDPIRTAPIIDRLFAQSVAMQMGGMMINIDAGAMEYPVTTSDISASWGADETGDIATAKTYATTDRPLKPDHNLAVTMKITRKALKQSGMGLEQAIRRDMNGAISEAMDAAVFQGSGAAGQPTGLFTGATDWGIDSTALTDAATWGSFRTEIAAFLADHAAASAKDVMVLFRPEIWNALDGQYKTGTAISEYDLLAAKVMRVVTSSNALAAPSGSGDNKVSKGVLTTKAGGVPPFYVGVWGGIDLIRDPYSDAASGQLKLTALATMDVTVSRAAQTRLLTGLK